MAQGTKVYKIEINGITTAITEVEQLIKQLDSLESRLNELAKKDIKVSVGGSAGGNATVDTDGLYKKILDTEQKIAQASEEDYQILLQKKAELKEIEKIQKSAFAESQAETKEYANTLNGLRQQLTTMKTALAGKEIGSEAFNKQVQDINELNNKIKEIEESYGQYSRNVGNYANGVSEGISKLKIDIAGTTKEFDNAKQALMEIKKEVQTLSTKKDLGIITDEESERLKSLIPTFAQLRSSIQDAGKPMDALMDTMQGIVAIASTAQGFGALFGLDNSKIQESIQKLVALQNALKGIEVIQKQMQTGEGIGKWFAKGNEAVDKMVANLMGVTTASKAAKGGLTTVAAANTAVATTAGAATIATKALSFALKTVGVGVLLTAIAVVVEGLQALVEWLTKTDDAVEKAKKENDEMAKAYAKASTDMTVYTNKCEKFNGTKKQEKKLVEELNQKFGETLGTYKSIAKWTDVLRSKTDAYIDDILLQAKAQAALNEVTEGYINLWKTEKDIAAGKYKSIFLTEEQEAMREAAAYAKAENDLAARQNRSKEIEKEIDEHRRKNGLYNYAPQVEEGGKKTVAATKNVEREIAKARIDAMREGLTKTLAQLEYERNKRIAEAKKTGKDVEEQVYLINQQYDSKVLDAKAKYYAERLRLEEDFQRSLKQMQEATFNQEIANSKELGELRKQQAQDALFTRPAEEGGNYSAYVPSMTYDYNIKIDKKTIESWRNLEVAIRTTKDALAMFAENSERTEVNFMSLDEHEARLKKLNEEYERLIKQHPELIKLAEDDITADIAGAYERRMLLRKTYYKEYYDIAKKYADRELEIEKDRIDKEKKYRLEEEEDRHKKSYGTLIPDNMLEGGIEQSSREELDVWLNSLNEAVQKGEITWEDYIKTTGATAIQGYLQAKTELENFLSVYNKMSADEQEANKGKLAEYQAAANGEYVKFFKNLEAEQETHNNRMSVIRKQAEVDEQAAIQNHLRQIQAINAENFSKIDDEIENILSSISNRLDNAKVENAWGILNYTKTKDELKDLQKTVEKTLNDIQKQKDNLNKARQNKEISFEQYDTEMAKLKTLEIQTTETAGNIEHNLKHLGEDLWKGINEWIQAVGQAAGQILSSLSEMQNNKYKAMIDQQQEYIDKYSDLLDLQRQKTEDYANAVNDIEGELATARGDRREQLIDQLNAQIAAQRASLAEEKRIQREQEKAEKKKKKLEHDQAVAKKKMDLAQAYINAAMAVSMAAVNKWPIPAIPMMALAAAVGAAQIAAVQSQKIPSYGEGGLLIGRKHSEGGIKVLGGTAEVEGGEYITNRRTTALNQPVLEYINSNKRKLTLDDFINFYSGNGKKKIMSNIKTKFEDGGTISAYDNSINTANALLSAFETYANRPVYVSVKEITETQQHMTEVQTLAGL